MEPVFFFLSRFTDFVTGANLSSTWTVNSKFSEQAAYNNAGYITSITRTNSAGASSKLEMIYAGGYRLYRVKVGTVSSPLFVYDKAGNITHDTHTGVQFSYYNGRLPNKIFAGTDQITYIYNAHGQKLVSTAAGSSTFYMGPMIYTNTAAATAPHTLSQISFEGGAILHSGGTYTYQYFKTDHTGSTRAVLQATGTNTLKRVQRTDYYPYGLAHEYSNLNLNRFLYSGKELMTDNMASASTLDYPGKGTLGLYDFGARLYNPLYGRWLNTDPAWQFANPYLYCGNNPAMYTDPNGEFAWFLPMIIGGVTNLIANAGKINGNFWKGLGYFAGGAAVGVASAGVGSWAASVSKALGAFPGALVGGGMGAATGGTMSVFSNGINNAISGANFFSGWQRSLTSGAISGGISGAISGGIDGYKRASEQGADKWTGYKIVDEESYSASVLKEGVAAQPDPAINCIGPNGEYVSQGHDNLTAEDFIAANERAKVNNPVYAAAKVKPGAADPQYVMEEVYANSEIAATQSTSVLDGQTWRNIGTELNRAQFMGVSNEHIVVITGVKVGYKARIFGGGVGPLRLTGTSIWNSIPGKHVLVGPTNYQKVTKLIYF